VNRTEKAAIVAGLNTAFAEASCLFLADYRGLTVEQVTDLRRKCRAEGVQYRVVKNSLAKRSVEGTDKVALADAFVGPTAVAWGDDPIAPAKVLAEYAKDNEALELKTAIVEGQQISTAEIAALAKLPGKDALRSQLLSVLVAPMQQVVSVLAAPARDIVGVIDAYAKKLNEEG